MHSIQQRITYQILFVIVLASAIATGVLFVLIDDYFNKEFDRALLHKARSLITLTAQHNGEIELNFAGEYMPEYELTKGRDVEFFQLWFATQTLIEKSDSMMAIDPSKDLPFLNGAADIATFSDVLLPDGRKGRVVTTEFTPQPFEGRAFEPSSPEDDVIDQLVSSDEEIDPSSQVNAVFSVAKSTDRLYRSINTGLFSLIIIFSLLSAVVFFLCKVLVHRGLMPLKNISMNIGAIDPKALDDCADIHTKSKELQPIARQFNQLIERIRAEFENQSRFTGDVAHELRTPIAELKMLTEVAEKWPDDKETNEQFFIDAKEIANNMERTVSDLLELVRADAGNYQLVHEVLELNGLLESVAASHKSRAAVRGIDIEFNRIDSVMVNADKEKVLRVFNNIVSNAIQYADINSTVRIYLSDIEQTILVEISNQASTLERDDLDVMFKRFWRKDKSRTGDSNSGLGLSIVTELSKQVGLELSCSLTNGIFKVSFSGFSKS